MLMRKNKYKFTWTCDSDDVSECICNFINVLFLENALLFIYFIRFILEYIIIYPSEKKSHNNN